MNFGRARSLLIMLGCPIDGGVVYGLARIRMRMPIAQNRPTVRKHAESTKVRKYSLIVRTAERSP